MEPGRRLSVVGRELLIAYGLLVGMRLVAAAVQMFLDGIHAWQAAPRP